MLIQTPNLARKLQRALRLTSLPDSVLAPETVGVVVLEDLSSPLDDISRLCHAAAVVNAVAAEFPMLTLTRVGDPAAYDALISEVFVSTLTTQIVSVVSPTVAVLGMTQVAATFANFGLPGGPTSFFGFDTKAAQLAARSLYRFRLLANTMVRIPVKIRLGSPSPNPGRESCLIIGETANTNISGGFSWVESETQG